MMHQYIIQNPIKILTYSAQAGALVGAIYGFGKSIQNTRWSSLTTQLGNVIFNVFIMGLGGSIIGLVSPLSMGVVVHRLICRFY